MANYSALKNIINQYITTNGQGDITGAILNSVLTSMVDSVSAGFLYAGVASPADDPGSPDQQVFYIATAAGTYTNFGNVTLPNGISILKWSSSWSSVTILNADTINQSIDTVRALILPSSVAASAFIANKGIKWANGSEQSNNYYKSTNSIPVIPGTTLVLHACICDYSAFATLAAYDAAGNYVQSASINTNSAGTVTYVVPQGIFSVRVSTLSSKTNCSVDINPFAALASSLAKLSYYTECSTVAVNGQKVISLPDYVRSTNNRILIKMKYACTATDTCLLKVNTESNYELYYNGVLATKGHSWADGEVIDVYFDGQRYQATKWQTPNVSQIVLDNNIVYQFLDADFTINNVFIETNGSESSNSNYKTTDYISLAGIDHCDVVALMRNAYGGGIAFYDVNKKFITSIYNVESPAQNANVAYTLNASQIPYNATYMRVQAVKSSSPYPSVTVYINKSKMVNAIAGVYGVANSYSLSKSIATLSANASLTIYNTPDTKNGYSIGVSALIGKMGKIRVAKGLSAYAAGIIEVDGTNLYVYNPNAPTDTPTAYAHGLTIADLLTISIELPLNAARVAGSKYYATVRITTNNAQSFVQNDVPWIGCSGNVVVSNVSGSYSSVFVCMNGEAFKKDIWIFGDSYTDMWCNYLTPMNAYNCMIDGRSGRNSPTALTSLKNALKVGKPKTIVWAMGMNDGDSNAVSQNWLNAFNSVKEICQNERIELIPCTIPNTPTITNYYKNEVIKASGLPYIDIANIVGANAIGSSWFSGLLSGDNVHPSSKGSNVIANYVVTMLPGLYIE